MKLTLTKISRSSKDRDGNPLISKQGKPYTRIGIQCLEYPNKWLSGFGNKANMEWQEGDIVEVEVEERGEYLNFKMPSLTPTRDEFEKLQERVRQIEKKIAGLDVFNTESANEDNEEYPF